MLQRIWKRWPYLNLKEFFVQFLIFFWEVFVNLQNRWRTNISTRFTKITARTSFVEKMQYKPIRNSFFNIDRMLTNRTSARAGNNGPYW